MTKIEELIKDHVEYTMSIIESCLPIIRKNYEDAFLHGAKHQKELDIEKIKKLLEDVKEYFSDEPHGRWIKERVEKLKQDE